MVPSAQPLRMIRVVERHTVTWLRSWVNIGHHLTPIASVAATHGQQRATARCLPAGAGQPSSQRR
jgi:hypothetical protein